MTTQREQRQALEERKRRERQVDVANQIEIELTGQGVGPAGVTVTRYLLNRAKYDAIKAQAALVDADPTDAREIMLLQNAVRRHRELLEWISEAISIGNEAWEEMSDEDRARIEELLDQRTDT